MQPTPLRLLLGLFRGHASRYGLGALLLLATNALGLSVPWLLGRAVDRIEGGRPVGSLALAIVGIALAGAVVRVGSRWFFLGSCRRIEYELRRMVLERLVQLPRSYFDRTRVGDLMSRLVNDVRSIRSLMGPGLLYSVNVVFLYAIGLSIMISIDGRLTLWALAPFGPLVLVIWRISRRIMRHSRRAQERLGDLTSRVQENLAGMFVVKSYDAHDREQERFAAVSSAFLAENLAMTRARALMHPALAVGTGAGTLIILFLGGQQVAAGRMDLGDLVSFLAYLGLLAWPTYAMGWVLNIWQRSRPALERVAVVLGEVSDVADPPDAVALDHPTGRIEIRDLTFAHGTDDRTPALSGIDLVLEPGWTVALVGRVGSGKTTLLALLARLYTAPPDSIRIDGLPIERIRLDDLRRTIVQVPQDAFLFSRQIGQNIAYGAPDSLAADIRAAAGQARVEDEIDALADGFETLVGERGVTLSGGQRQRVTLARALLVEPTVLVLDDATSSLDSRTEKDILAELARLREGKTTILVTHRMGTVRLCDRIVVLDEGRLEAIGTHEELLETSPTYARMVERERLRAELEEIL